MNTPLGGKRIVTMLLMLFLGAMLDAGPNGLWVGMANADDCDTKCHLRLYNKDCAPPGFPGGGQCYRFVRTTCFMCSPFTGNQRCKKSSASDGTNCVDSGDPYDRNILYFVNSCKEECDCGTGIYQSWVEASNPGDETTSMGISNYKCQS